MYTYEEETKQQTATRTSNQSSFYAPTYDEEQDDTFLPFGEDEQEETSANEVTEYNRVSSYSDFNSTQEKRMYIQTLQQEKQEHRKTFKLNARGKIVLTVFSIIFAALLAFSIYNVVVINDLTASIALKNQAVANQTAVIKGLETEYNELEVDVDDGINMGYRETTSADYVEFVSAPRATKTITTVESNWFDRLCEFFSRLFG